MLSLSNLEVLRQELSGSWNVNWNSVLEKMRTIPLSYEVVDELVGMVVGYINNIFRQGSFSNLDGIEPVLDYLNMEVRFEATQLGKIYELCAKFSLSFLYSMSPPLYGGKLYDFDGPEYNRKEYTRGLLLKQGIPPEEATDEKIQELWDFREILVRLHAQIQDRALPSGTKRLSVFVRMLMEPT
jgi:hypothetical protein